MAMVGAGVCALVYIGTVFIAKRGQIPKIVAHMGHCVIGIFVRQVYINELNEASPKLLGPVLIGVYYFGGFYLIYMMYNIEYQILRRRPVRSDGFPTLKINIYHDFSYRMVEKTIFLLAAINIALLGLYDMYYSEPRWQTISCVVIGMLGLVTLGPQRLRLIQAWKLAKNKGEGWMCLDEQGIHWCFDVIEWSSDYRLGSQYRPVCQHHENFIAWHDVETVGSLKTQPPKRPKVFDDPDFVFICSDLLPPSNQQIQVLLPYI